jgi:radical SAM-linked protein
MTDPNQLDDKYRLRLTFAKKEQIKYIAHLDLALAWERALRRARIPLAHSQGFNPRPKMQVASSLPLGTTGQAEIIDIIVTEPISVEDALARIRPALPVGIALHAVEAVPLKAPTLQQLVRQAEYRVLVETELSEAELRERVAALLAAKEIIQSRQRRKKEEKFDLRPLLHELDLIAVSQGQAELHMTLTAGQFGNLRPEAVLKALDLADQWASIERTKLIFDDPPVSSQ